MPQIGINNFLGKNLKSDPLNLQQHEAQDLDGFEIHTKPGSLVKRKGYTDQADVILPASYPSSWTIKNFFQFRVNKPTSQNIMIVHAEVSGEDRIYVDYTHNGTIWVQGWVEITENEEELTCDAGTHTTTIYDAGLASDTADYYNGWYVFNWTRREGAIVNDYSGGTNYLYLKTAITGQTSGDSYSIWRFPMVVNFEGGSSGYSAHTGTSTTEAFSVDNPNTTFYQLQQGFDDAYNGWTLWNTGTDGNDSWTAAVTDYESFYANNSQRLTHASISTQAEDDLYYLYKKTRTLTVDDKIHFRQRPNQCIMALGNTARFPKQFPLWYGFLRETYYFGDTDNKIEDGYYLEPQTLDAPHDEIFSCDTQGSGDLGPDVGTMFVACAYQYDGYQIGEMTSIERAYSQRVVPGATDDARITFSIGYSAAPNMRYSRTLNKRVTGVIIYGATDLNTGSKTATWHRLALLPIREDFQVSSVLGYYSHNRAKEDSPVGNRRTWSKRSTITPGGRTTRTRNPSSSTSLRDWSGSDPYARTFDITSSVWSDRADYYTLDSGGMGGDIVNYSIGDDSMYHSVAADLFLDKSESSLIIASPLKDDGTPSPDWFPLLNLLDAANYGLYDIYNIKIINDYLFLFGGTKCVRLQMSSGLVPAFKLDGEYEGIGTESIYSIEKYKNKIFGLFKNGFHFLSGDEEYLSYAIEDITSYPVGVTTLSEAYAKYYPLAKLFIVVFPTDKKMFTYDAIRRQWAVHTIDDAINSLVIGADNEIYGADADKIYKMDNGTVDDAASIDPTWKSKVYSLGTLEAPLKEMEITYKSNTAIQFDVFLDRSASAASWATATDNQFAASSTTTTVMKKFPTNFRASQFEFKVSIPSGSLATNTQVEVDSINIEIIPEERL